jgi:hypothetical protein
MAQQARALIPVERIQQAIFLIRGEKVMLDFDLAALYGVEIRVLVQAVKRNIQRFPDDFMFQLTKEEYGILRSQIVILKRGRGQHRKYLPHAFTEQGVAMLSSVLNSERAVKVNVEIMRAFVRLRAMLASNKELARRLDELEKKHDKQFKLVFDAIREFMESPAFSRRCPAGVADSGLPSSIYKRLFEKNQQKGFGKLCVELYI